MPENILPHEPTPNREPGREPTFDRIDVLCDEFERAWQAGEGPRVEALLERAASSARPRLLTELLKVELEYRRKAGESPRREEYATRFTEYPEGLDAVFGPAETSETPDASRGAAALTAICSPSQADPVDAATVSRRIASNSEDRTVKVWDAGVGEERRVLRGHMSLVTNVAFNPDGRRIVSRDQNGNSIVWDGRTGERLDGEEAPAVRVQRTVSPDRLFRVVSDGLDVYLIRKNPRYDLWAEDTARRRATAPSYHDRLAAEAVQAQDWFTARFHLRALLDIDRRAMAERDQPRAAAGEQRRRRWLSDPALGLVRDPSHLRGLPDGERAEWRKFWDDVWHLDSPAVAERSRMGGSWWVRSWRSQRAAGRFVTDLWRSAPDSLRIASQLHDDIHVFQAYAVKPHTRYRLSGWVMTEGVRVIDPRGRWGAGLAIWGTKERSQPLEGTRPWTHLSVDFYSGERTTVDAGPRLGHHASTAIGKAWFDDITLIELSAPAVAE